MARLSGLNGAWCKELSIRVIEVLNTVTYEGIPINFDEDSRAAEVCTTDETSACIDSGLKKEIS